MLNEVIGEGVESLDYPREGAAVFLQAFEHRAEFQQSVGLAWSSDDLRVDEISLAGTLAALFKAEVLLEPSTVALPSGYSWCLVTPDRQLYAVETVDVDDGIDLRQGAPRLRIER
ncbi:MAG TPA: hypothetical protein VN156_06945 [Pseudomonas sp.]|nr:hypothetical protein [Pseudomonas sp.]